MAKSKFLPYLRKTLFVLAVVALTGILVVLWQKHQKDICSEVVIEIVVPLDKQLLTEFHIQDYLDKIYSGGLVGLTVGDIDLNDIEKRIRLLPAVSRAEVSFQINGTLNIEIDQKIPIVRVYENESSSFYLDFANNRIPAVDMEAARVPIATGALSEGMIKKIYTLSTYVQENRFMEALVEQIFVTDDGDLIIIPKFKSQQIIIGDTTELESKFKRLELFYKEGLKHIGWEKYKTINLKFADQIVCN